MSVTNNCINLKENLEISRISEQSSRTFFSQEKIAINSPKFPSRKNLVSVSNDSIKPKIKSSCVDFFSKEENVQSLILKNNNSKETLSDNEKTPTFNLMESISLLHNNSQMNNNPDDSHKNLLFELKLKGSKPNLISKVDLIQIPIITVNQNNIIEKQIVIKNSTNNINFNEKDEKIRMIHL
jgi:hypothetical protein